VVASSVRRYGDDEHPEARFMIAESRELPTPTEMRRAFAARDSAYDGIFVVGVTSTGIFCRPSCPARRPRPENVAFFADARAALFAGFRACKRCRPLTVGDPLPDWAERLITHVRADPARRLHDADLRQLGLEPARVRRLFARRYGLTFHAFCRGHRLADAFLSIKRGHPLDDAVFAYGYESHSGFREAFSLLFGAPPKRGTRGDCLRIAWIETPLGPMIVGAVEGGICFLEFTDRRMLEAQIATLRRRFRLAVVAGENAHVAALRRELDSYFTGKRRRFDVPVVLAGTEFQLKVWRALCRIPPGQTTSYEALAREIGVPAAARAVGRANGMNRIAILVPCHRAVNKSGALGGYGGGLWRKRRLLELEGAGRRSRV
jgi:AraC family transcriptional regulator, regulatory protein of adaptative response / methylated-DNA-[protein]-cysteine methyltransferase